MTKSNIGAALLSVSLDRSLKPPLHAQLTESIRRLTHEQRLISGDRLPPSRVLAAELSVSRITVTTAYDQLVSEGYLVARRGSGVFIAPDLASMPRPPEIRDKPVLTHIAPPPPVIPFQSVVPDQQHFPHADWARLLDLTWRAPGPELLGKPDPLGLARLRVAIAGHLRDWRGITCDPQQIVITSGLTEAIELIAKAVLKPSDTVLVEDPGYQTLRAAFKANGMQSLPTQVDGDGLTIDAQQKREQEFHAIAVTPSRQFPLGMTMPLSRRLRLLRWAQDTNGFIVEDDYDGEFRYQGRPLPALMRLDDRDRVIYVGSFSKVMFPGLRLGFVVFPAPVLGRVRTVMALTGPRATIVTQPALARFIEDGQFATHIRRMRRLYAHRQRVLLSAIQAHCAGLLIAEPAAAGMHLVVRLSRSTAARMTDVQASALAHNHGVAVQALSTYYVGTARQQGLILGYAGFDDEKIETGIVGLRQALQGQSSSLNASTTQPGR